MKNSLLTKIFSRRDTNRSLPRLLSALPDPDPVLQRTGKMIETYRLLTADAHVFANIQQRKAGTTSLKWQVRAQADSPQNALINRMLNGLDIESMVSQILDAVFYGYSVLEILWEYKNAAWLPVAVEEKPQEWFFFDDQNVLKYRGDPASDGISLPDNKFLLVQHQASFYNPYGEKILSRCYWPVTFKKNGFQFWMTFTEKYGLPFLLGKQPRNTEKSETDSLLDSLEKMLTDTMAVVPDDSSVSFLEGSKSYSSDVYKKFLEFCNSEISKAILSQTLTTEIQERGTYAASKTHLEVYDLLVQGDKRLVEKTMNTLIRMACYLNFPDTDNAVIPVFELYEENDVKAALAERDNLLQKQGVAFTAEYYRRNYNLGADDIRMPGQQQR